MPFGLALFSLGKVCLCIFGVTQAVIRISPAVIHPGIPGIEFYGKGEVLNSQVIFTFLVIGLAPVIIGLYILGLEFQGLMVVC